MCSMRARAPVRPSWQHFFWQCDQIAFPVTCQEERMAPVWKQVLVCEDISPTIGSKDTSNSRHRCHVTCHCDQSVTVSFCKPIVRKSLSNDGFTSCNSLHYWGWWAPFVSTHFVLGVGKIAYDAQMSACPQSACPQSGPVPSI